MKKVTIVSIVVLGLLGLLSQASAHSIASPAFEVLAQGSKDMPPASEISVEGGPIEEILHTETSDYRPLPSSTRTITSMDGMRKLMDEFPLPSPKPGAFRVHLPLAYSRHGNEALAMASDILLVDDDDGTTTGHNVESYYGDALTHNGYAYDYWDTSSSGSPSLATLQGYSTVIWFTGSDYTSTLSPTDESTLASYLDGGGSLFLCSQDYLYDQGLTSFEAITST